MTALDVTSAAAALKVYYSDQRITQLMYKDAPLWAMLPKYTDFYGDSYPLPLKVALSQGRSSTFASAQANKVPSNYQKFSLTRARDYSLASIDSESWMASEVNPGAFVKLATDIIDDALGSLKRALGWTIYGSGNGMLGKVAGSTSITAADPAVITLDNAEDIVKFEVGQTLQARNTGTARVFASGVTTALVVAVDRDAGTITTDVDNSGDTDTFTTDTSLNVVGDYNVKAVGLAGWIPSSTPAATAFFGLDRTIDPTRLAGVRVSGSAMPKDEAFISAARRIGREGASPDYGFVSFADYASLEKTLGARVIYDNVEVAGVGFRGIKISGPTRPITILPDKDAPANKAYLLTMDTWGYYSLKQPVQLLDLDGNRVLREGSADAYEVRVGTFGNCGCDHPGANAVLSFT